MFDKSDEEHWYALKVFYNRVFEVERLRTGRGEELYSVALRGDDRRRADHTAA